MNGGRLADFEGITEPTTNSGGGGNTLFHLPCLATGWVDIKVGVISTLGARPVVETSCRRCLETRKAREVGAGNANFFAKNKHLTGASTFFQPGGFKGMGTRCRPNGGAVLCFMVVFVVISYLSLLITRY